MKNPYINQNLYKLKAKLEEFSLEHNNSYEIKRELGEYLSAPKLLKNGENVPFVLNNEEKVQIKFPKSKKKRIRKKWRKLSKNFFIRKIHLQNPIHDDLEMSLKFMAG